MLEDEANVKGNENMSTEMSIDAFFLSLSLSLSGDRDIENRELLLDLFLVKSS